MVIMRPVLKILATGDSFTGPSSSDHNREVAAINSDDIDSFPL